MRCEIYKICINLLKLITLNDKDLRLYLVLIKNANKQS